jgi:hypothetical protein
MMYSTGSIKNRRGPRDTAELGAGHKSLTIICVRKSPGGDSRLAREEGINAYQGFIQNLIFVWVMFSNVYRPSSLV